MDPLYTPVPLSEKDMRLNDRVALVTGGSRGIGAAIARRLARDGAAVTITYSSARGDAEEVVRAIEAQGGRAMALPLDLKQRTAVSATFDEVARQLGPVSIVVANAGDILSK